MPPQTRCWTSAPRAAPYPRQPRGQRLTARGGLAQRLGRAPCGRLALLTDHRRSAVLDPGQRLARAQRYPAAPSVAQRAPERPRRDRLPRRRRIDLSAARALRLFGRLNIARRAGQPLAASQPRPPRRRPLRRPPPPHRPRPRATRQRLAHSGAAPRSALPAGSSSPAVSPQLFFTASGAYASAAQQRTSPSSGALRDSGAPITVPGPFFTRPRPFYFLLSRQEFLTSYDLTNCTARIGHAPTFRTLVVYYL